MNILQHDVFSSIISFPINNDKKNQRANGEERKGGTKRTRKFAKPRNFRACSARTLCSQLRYFSTE